MTSRITIFVLAIATSGIPNSTHGQSDPQWIGPARDGTDIVELTTYELEKQFVVDQAIEAATLRVAADFCDVEVVLNGHRIAKVSPYDFCSPISVTRWCRKGNNSCKLIVHSWGIPVAAAVDLRVQDGEGGVKVLSTDNSWSLSKNGVQQPTTEYGAISSEPWWHVQKRPTTNAFDEYNQWKDAATEVGVHSAKLIVPPDFSVEAIYQVPKQHGSWISMTLDDRGRLLVGKEKSGVLRVTLQSTGSPKIEEINTHLQGCHGIIWTPQGLFVNASDSRALYRLRDTNQDDEFDEWRRLR